MLGVIENRKPITGEFVTIVRESLRRAVTGQLTPKEQASKIREKEVSELYNIEWQ